MFDKELYEKFKDHITLPEDYTNAVWTYYEGLWEVYWNEYGNVRELVEGEGDTSSAEVCGRRIEKDGYLLFTLYNGCGDTYQAIFDLSKKVDVDKY